MQIALEQLQKGAFITTHFIVQKNILTSKAVDLID
jgi:hypothetical protein